MSATDGKRIYAIGDIHGCRDLLLAAVDRVRADLAAEPHPDPLLVFLGDYVDRGPDSRGVIETLCGIAEGPLPARFLLGNHDMMFRTYLDDPGREGTRRYHWLDLPIGGQSTLVSYGVARARPGDREAHAAALAAVPAHHVAFLDRTALHLTVGSYLFVHAGIRPGVALDDQTREDLVWIRDPFLFHDAPFPEGVVVHGHTPVRKIEHHGNRIAIDTGAVFGGPLSVLGLQDDAAFELADGGGRIAVVPGADL